MDFFDYFQIVVLVVFYIVFLGRAIQLRMRGVNPLALGGGKRGIESVMEIAFVIGLTVWTMEIVSHSLHLELRIFPPLFYARMFDIVVLKALGAVMIAAGLTLFILSLISFGSSWRVGIDTRSAGDLVTTGVFSISRNPIFLFLDAYFFGSWLIYPDPFFLIFAVIAAVGTHWQILQEEKFLAEKYGAEYSEYRRRVRRYL